MGKYNPAIHHRHSIRLKGYDYSRAGFYFVTMNTQNRLQLFGKIRNGVMIPSPAGEMVEKVWLALPERFECVFLHEFVIMPDHFHGIIEMRAAVGAALVAAQLNTGTKRAGTRPARTVGDVIGAFKSLTTYKYIQGVREDGWPPFEKRLWQRNYYEHIIRSERAYQNISAYIRNNPARWWEKHGLDQPGATHLFGI